MFSGSADFSRVKACVRRLTDTSVPRLYSCRVVEAALFLNWETEDPRYPGLEAGLRVRSRAVVLLPHHLAVMTVGWN